MKQHLFPRWCRIATSSSLVFLLAVTLYLWDFPAARGSQSTDSVAKLEAAMSLPQAQDRPELHDATFYYEQGLASYRAGRYDEAVVAFESATKLKTDFAEAHNNLGYCYYILGQHQKATEALSRAIQLKPDLAVAYSNLGNVYIALRQSKLAILSFEAALRLGLDDEVTRCSLGVAYYRTRRYREAAESFRQAINLKTDYAVAHYNLGVAYLALKNNQLALEQHTWLKTAAPFLATELFNGIYGKRILVITEN